MNYNIVIYTRAYYKVVCQDAKKNPKRRLENGTFEETQSRRMQRGTSKTDPGADRGDAPILQGADQRTWPGAQGGGLDGGECNFLSVRKTCLGAVIP